MLRDNSAQQPDSPRMEPRYWSEPGLRRLRKAIRFSGSQYFTRLTKGRPVGKCRWNRRPYEVEWVDSGMMGATALAQPIRWRYQVEPDTSGMTAKGPDRYRIVLKQGGVTFLIWSTNIVSPGRDTCSVGESTNRGLDQQQNWPGLARKSQNGNLTAPAGQSGSACAFSGLMSQHQH